MPASAEERKQEVTRLVETYSTLLLRVAMHQTSNRSDAEDAVQMVFLKLLRLAPVFINAEHEKAWLIRVTINQCHDIGRQVWNKRVTALTASLPLPTKEQYPEVAEAVRALPEKYSIVVFLYYFEGYSTAEVARLLEIPQNTVESRLHRARARLKNLLKEDWDV